MFVNIRGCLEDAKLVEIVQKQVVRLIMPAINAIPANFLGELFKFDEFKTIFFDTIERLVTGEWPDFDTLSQVIDNALEVAQCEAKEVMANILEDGMEGIADGVQACNFQDTMVAPPEEPKSDRPESIGKRFVKKLIDVLNGRQISTDLRSSGFNYVSGPMHLLADLKANQRLQVEFDRLESSRSTACLQIRSDHNQVDFKNLHNRLKVLS